jgi:hypothetical protein
MDITQLVITLASVVGIVLVGAMAVLPSVMEAWDGRDEPRSAVAGRRRLRRGSVDLAA